MNLRQKAKQFFDSIVQYVRGEEKPVQRSSLDYDIDLTLQRTIEQNVTNGVGFINKPQVKYVFTPSTTEELRAHLGQMELRSEPNPSPALVKAVAAAQESANAMTELLNQENPYRTRVNILGPHVKNNLQDICIEIDKIGQIIGNPYKNMIIRDFNNYGEYILYDPSRMPKDIKDIRKYTNLDEIIIGQYISGISK